MVFCKVVFFYKIIVAVAAAASLQLRGIFLIFLCVYRRGLFLFEDDMFSCYSLEIKKATATAFSFAFIRPIFAPRAEFLSSVSKNLVFPLFELARGTVTIMDN